MENSNRAYLLMLLIISLSLGTFMVTGCGDSYGTPYSYQALTPNDGAVSIKIVNNSSVNGGLHAPSHATTWDSSSAGSLIKIYPDDIWLSISDMSIFSTDGKEYVLFTEPKEINLLNLLKEGELVALATDVPVGSYNRLKFTINYIRVYQNGLKSKIAMDETIYISTNDSSLTTFPVESGMNSSVKLNFDIMDKVFKDRNGNIRIYPSVYAIYEGMSLVRRQ